LEITVPSPAHVGHGITLITCQERALRATHFARALRKLCNEWCRFPGSAPVPVQRSQLTSSFAVTVFSTPLATSESFKEA
jgi:hypothetical protein